jgi:hypothetical protein
VDGQVRGQAIISLVLLEEPNDGNGGCLATRLVSFDLAGSVSLHLTNIIIAQQAGLPTVVEDFLHRNEPVTPHAYTLPLTYDNAWQHVVSRVAKPQLMMTNHNSNNNGGVLDTNDHDPVGEIFAVNGDGNGTHQKDGGTAPSSSSSSSSPNELPSLEHQAMLLLAPVLFHKMVMLVGMSGSSFVFALSVFCAVRQLVILHLGEHLGHSVAAINTVTCRFSVDPKGMQRFVANKREEREELQRKTTSTEVVLPLHLVVSAVARALQETRQICRKRVQYPMLLIDRVVTYTGSVDVTVLEKDKHWTVRQVTAKSVTDIAKSRAVSGGEKTSTETCGQCLVVALDDSETTQLVIDATSEQRDIVVIAIIQGLGKINSQSAPAELPFLRGRRGGSTFQVAVSLTIRGHSESLIQDAEAFALECQKMLQFPEICED